MEFNQYNTTVQQWIHTVLENRETNADGWNAVGIS